MHFSLHPSWETVLHRERTKPYFSELTIFVDQAYTTSRCYPHEENIFRAFALTPFDQVKVVILGQDPYHTAGAAMGLSFSVPQGSRMQPSLRNILKELSSDMMISRTETDLTDWARQGVLLLNSVLTVEEGKPASHRGKGWEIFTDAIIRTLSEKRDGIIFLLWGNFAIEKSALIDESRHTILTSPHPSPFSAYTGFFGSRPFSRVNTLLGEQNISPINW